MNKTEFIEKLSKGFGTIKTEDNKKFNSVIKCIAQAIRDNDELKFAEFGRFKVKQTKAMEIKTLKGNLQLKKEYEITNRNK